MPCVVYWLFDDRCVCPWRHGYIGISVEFDARLSRHRTRAGTRKSAVGVPAIFDHKILFTGTVDECVAWEARLRPHKNIGWNRAQGGREPWLDYKHDDEMRAKLSALATGRVRGPNSPEARARQSAAAKLRYRDPDQRAATAAHLKSLAFDRSGANNGHFGKSQSEEAKKKIGERNSRSVCKQGHPKEPGQPCRECQRRWCREAYYRRKAKNGGHHEQA